MEEEVEKEEVLDWQLIEDVLQKLGENQHFPVNVFEQLGTMQFKIIDPQLTKQQILEFFQQHKQMKCKKIKKKWTELELKIFLCSMATLCKLNEKVDQQLDLISKIMFFKDFNYCKYKWLSMKTVEIEKSPWSQNQDQILKQLIMQQTLTVKKDIPNGIKSLKSSLTKRKKSSAKENSADPNMKRQLSLTRSPQWEFQEDILIMKQFLQFGSKWALIAKKLGSRTQNSVRNRFRSLIKKYQKSIKIDYNSLTKLQINFIIEKIQQERNIEEELKNILNSKVSSSKLSTEGTRSTIEYIDQNFQIFKKRKDQQRKKTEIKQQRKSQRNLTDILFGNTIIIKEQQKDKISEEKGQVHLPIILIKPMQQNYSSDSKMPLQFQQ